MINRVVLVGRLTRDPELRYTPNGVAVANFSVAVHRPYSNQKGERETDFFNGVVWRKQAENLSQFMKKGNLIGIDGRLQSRKYERQDGQQQTVIEVVADSIQFLESNKDTQKGNQNSRKEQHSSNSGALSGSYKPVNMDDPFGDDHLPF
ncbi:single-stranded DNA-binding protein [Bacillus piscicola]|uniref:single-stranded DNA-binding protein n=1 Tax=Bacillus piscicola TaxID=1632684 RepID=UPI001F08B143|nr:single-stranded DNA-binding protein [Bacillus piscicola]